MKNEETMMLTEQLVEIISDSISITNQYEINMDGEKINKIKNILKNNNNYFDIDSIISNHLETVISKMDCKKLFEKTWSDNLDSLTKGIYDKLYRRDKNMIVEKTGHIMIPDIDKIKIILNELIERNGIFIIHHDEGIKVILNYDLMMKKNLNVNEFDIMSDIIKDTVERTYNKSKICKISITKLLDELSLVYNDYVMNIEKVIVF